MNLEIIKQKDLPLLSRKRVSLWYNEEGKTPGRDQLIAEIVKKFKTKKDLVIIKHIYPQFGTSKAKIIAHIYKDRKKLEFFEHSSLVGKHKLEDSEKSAKQETKKPLKKEKKPEEKKETREEKK
ncbi:hypothetical protein GF327_00265 [Candidatus Woesearchaeota archaeon]|nr:hypothetical protein [Candidatus Woesearchaeota archaeon]